MKIIDSDNYAAAGIETLAFPGGEPHVKVPTFNEYLLLYLKIRNIADLLFAALVQDTLIRQGARFRTFIPYFPGARQDKSDGTAPFTVEVLSRIFKSPKRIFVFDPHSEVLSKYLEFLPLMPSDMPMAITPVVGVIAPDAGARNRAWDYLKKFHHGMDFIECSKVRDPHTGTLSNYKIPSIKRPGRYIIVDDICDGGGTFNLLAEAFFKSDRTALDCQLELFVSHGIFSKGLENIDKRILTITTTDSWCIPEHHSKEIASGRLRVLPLIGHLSKYLRD